VIYVSPLLLRYGKLLPLHPDGTKKPWLRFVIKHCSNDPAQIKRWIKNKPGCYWGLRITSDERMFIDEERPGKGSVEGGAYTIAQIEAKFGTYLPDGPSATSECGGLHRAFHLPLKYRERFRNWNKVFPSVDIRVLDGMVGIPPSGTRTWIKSFDDIGLPELPEWFCEHLLSTRLDTNRKSDREDRHQNVVAISQTVSERAESSTVAYCQVSEVLPRHDWFRLWRSGDFGGLWNATRHLLNDDSHSASEFSICVFALLCGLSAGQAHGLVMSWWTKHGIEGKYARFSQYILPAAVRKTQKRVDAWRAAQAVKRAAKTNAKIQVYQTDHAGATTQQIADGLGMTYDAIFKALKRIRTKGELRLNAKHTNNGLADHNGLRTSQITETNRLSGQPYDPPTDFREGGPYPLPEGPVQERFIGLTSYPGRHTSPEELAWRCRPFRYVAPKPTCRRHTFEDIAPDPASVLPGNPVAIETHSLFQVDARWS
jgi:hypothetical protein